MISLLQRHLFKELVLLFVISCGGLLILLLIGQILQLRRLILSLDLTVLDIGYLFVCLSPFFMQFLIPIACLMSVFLVFLRMSSDRELIAMKACGLSLYQFLPAPIIFCLLCMILNLYISLFGLAMGMSGFKEALLGYAQTKTQLILQPGIFNRDFPGLTLYAEQVDSAKGELRNVIVIDETQQPHRTVMLAPEGHLQTDPEAGRLLFSLGRGQMYMQENNQTSTLSFDSYRVRLDLSLLFKDMDLGVTKPKEMSWSKLLQTEADPETWSEQNITLLRKIQIEKQKRFVLPTACLIMGLFAIPLACSFEGLRQQYAAFFAFILIMLYYALFSLGMNLGETGAVDPRFGMWAPNAVFLILALVGLRMAAREQYLHVGNLISRFSERLITRLRSWRRA